KTEGPRNLRAAIQGECVELRRGNIIEIQQGSDVVGDLNILVVVIKGGEIYPQAMVQEFALYPNLIGVQNLRQIRQIAGVVSIDSAAFESSVIGDVGKYI